MHEMYVSRVLFKVVVENWSEFHFQPWIDIFYIYSDPFESDSASDPHLYSLRSPPIYNNVSDIYHVAPITIIYSYKSSTIQSLNNLGHRESKVMPMYFILLL